MCLAIFGDRSGRRLILEVKKPAKQPNLWVGVPTSVQGRAETPDRQKEAKSSSRDDSKSKDDRMRGGNSYIVSTG